MDTALLTRGDALNIAGICMAVGFAVGTLVLTVGGAKVGKSRGKAQHGKYPGSIWTFVLGIVPLTIIFGMLKLSFPEPWGLGIVLVGFLASCGVMLRRQGRAFAETMAVGILFFYCVVLAFTGAMFLFVMMTTKDIGLAVEVEALVFVVEMFFLMVALGSWGYFLFSDRPSGPAPTS